MSIIHVEQLSKEFKVPQKKEGLKNSIHFLFKKEFKNVSAVKNISFDIREKEIVGLIGLNGAGKTTTLKMLTGLIYPTEGSVEVLGFNPWERRNEFLKNIGFLMGNKSQLWWDLPAVDSFYLEGEIYNIEKNVVSQRIKKLTELLDVSHLLNTPVRKLSLGERMKMELVLVLLHRPQVLCLDEPTIGLDIISQKNIRKFLCDYRDDREATIIITSHNMKDIEEICSRIIIINEGKLLYDDSLNRLKEKYDDERIIIVKYSDEKFIEMVKSGGGIFDGKEFEVKGKNEIFLKVKGEEVMSIKETLLKMPYVTEVSITSISLEDILSRLLQVN